jgi:ferredoxin
MTRVMIDGDRCQGHGGCVMVAPQAFDVDDSGVGRVLLDQVPDPDLPDVREAVLSCPESAVALSG